MAADPLRLGITFLGCGKLSSAILEGIISSLSDHALRFDLPNPKIGNVEKSTPVQPSALIACVHQEHSASELKEKFAKSSTRVQVLANENVRGVKEGAVIILGVEPSVYQDVLAEEGMHDALSGKILVSIVGGVSIAKLRKAIYGEDALAQVDKEEQCQIIKVIPSTASAVRDSFTLIIEEDEPYPPSTLNPVYSLFLRVGSVRVWPDALGPVGATLSASSPAFFALMLEGAVEGAVELGINRAEALQMAAAAMRGAAGLIASGEEPREVRRKVATPGGSTEAGLKLLEERRDAKNVMKEAFMLTANKVAGLGDKKAEA